MASTPHFHILILASHWELVGSLFSQLSQSEYLECSFSEEIPPGAKGVGASPCDPFGSECRMWECPDYFTLDGIYVFKYSDQVLSLNALNV